jgi:hypothetical protein
LELVEGGGGASPFKGHFTIRWMTLPYMLFASLLLKMIMHDNLAYNLLAFAILIIADFECNYSDNTFMEALKAIFLLFLYLHHT